MPKDVRHLLRKALQTVPGFRYTSPSALGDDVNAFLDGRPVKAHSHAAVYRASKFVRRHHMVAMSAIAAFLLTISTIGFAHQEVVIANKRTDHIRQLTRMILNSEEVHSGLHNASQSLRKTAAMSKRYLETADPDARRQPRVALEIAEAYSELARAEGICITSSTSGRKQAIATLGKAMDFLAPFSQPIQGTYLP